MSGTSRMTLPRTILVCLLALLGPGACTLSDEQQQATLAFGQAASNFGDFAAGELREMRARAVQLDLERYRFPGTNQAIASGDYRTVGGALTAERLALRLAGANALKSYGVALIGLITADDAAAARAAGEQLVANLKSLPIAGAALSEEDAGTMTAVLSRVTGFLTAAVKRDALAKIVPVVKPKIDALCGELGRDLDRSKAGAAAALNIVVSSLLVTATANVASGDIGTRYRAVEDFARARDTEDRLALVAQKAGAAVQGCLRANEALATSFSAEGAALADIQAFASIVRELRSYGLALPSGLPVPAGLLDPMGN